jgi:hypothetical protein
MMHLLFILLSIVTTIVLLFSSLSLLPPNTSRASTTKWRTKGEVDMLLGIETNNKGWDIDYLFSNPNMSLTDKNAGMMNGLRKAKLVNASLQTTFQEIFDLQSQDVIKLHARFVEDANANETANKSVAFEETLRIFLVKGEKLTVESLEVKYL